MRTAILVVLAVLVAIGGLRSPSSASVTSDRTVLIDQAGRPFTLRTLAGRPLLLTFVATRCTDACPIANAAFRALQRELDRRRSDAELLTVTLDPRHDTPFVMARIGREIGARPSRWRFASGQVADVQRLLDAFGVVVRPNAEGIPDEHTTFVYVLGRDGHVERSLLLSTDFVRQALQVLAHA